VYKITPSISTEEEVASAQFKVIEALKDFDNSIDLIAMGIGKHPDNEDR